MIRNSIILLIALFIIQSACVKESVTTSSGAKIRFSVDTLHFDTVFTQLGSATRFVKIFNEESQDLILSEVTMEGGSTSSFRINVDGLDGTVVRDIRIPAEDSIYVFVEVTVDPDQPVSQSPFVIEEDLIVRYNNTESRLLVDAWGQNANYIPNRFNRTRVYRLDCDDQLVWNDPKPYVIYGLLYIDSCDLFIAPGTQIHIHGGIGRNIDTAGNVAFFNDGNIVIGPEGSIISNGSLDQPVVFQGDRLEPEFDDVSGQWNGIRMLPGSKGNALTFTVIRNSIFGIYVDSLCELTLNKSIIQNTSSAGLFCFHPSLVSVNNSLFFLNGGNSIAASCGGNYNFNYVTVANYGNDREGVFLSDNFCYDFPECERWCYNDLNANFTNCIMTGSNDDELWLSTREDVTPNLSITNSLLRLKDLLKVENYPNFFNDYTSNSINWQRTDSLFASVSDNNYRPDTLSILEEKAVPLRGFINDLENNQRDFSRPDIGCYEYQY